VDALRAGKPGSGCPLRSIEPGATHVGHAQPDCAKPTPSRASNAWTGTSVSVVSPACGECRSVASRLPALLDLAPSTDRPRSGGHSFRDYASARASPGHMEATAAEATMSAGIVRSVVDGCLQQGVPRDVLLHAIGTLDLRGPEARVPLARAHDVLRRLQPFQYELVKTPASFVRCTDCGLPGFMLLTAPTMECLLDSFCRYYRLVVNLGHWQPARHSEGIHLRYELAWDTDLASAWVEAAVSTAVSLLRDALVEVPIRRVRFRHPAPPNAAAQSRFFGCPVVFGADDDCIEISYRVMDAEARMRNEPMYRYFEKQVAAQLASADRFTSFIDQARAVILATIPSGDSSEAVIARKLGLGERTLRRKLEEHGSCFRQLLEQARITSARRMLREPGKSVSEIATALGFSEVSAFSRAFRRASGTSPRAYRVSLADPKRSID